MSKLENNSIPVNIADSIINELPKELFIDPLKKFCYASIVDDYIIRKLYDKLNEGLKDIIVDEDERKRHILDNMIYGISLSKARTRLVKARSIIKNIYTKNILEDDISDMPKFDFIIQNPPYNKSLHLDFFNKGLDLLSDTGKMVIIEPSTWLIELRQNITEKKSSQMNKYIALKERIKGHVSRVVVENFNIEFRTDNYMPFAITYIDKSKEYKNIKYSNCGIVKYVNSLYDCNLIGDIKTIKSIFEKIKKYDVVNNHIYIPSKSEKIEGYYYCKIAGIISGSGSQLCALFDPLRSSLSSNELNNIAKNINFNDDSNIMFENNGIRKHLQVYSTTLFHRYKNNISQVPLHKYDRGKHETDKEAECVTGTKQEIENWKYYVFNNSLPLFINICLTIDQHNNSLPYVPWLVDKQYTDEEIYEMFGFNDEEIKLIETTIKKYERYSPWFKRYMCGPSSVSDEEVQNFINELENA